ncbi:hypothetical protein R3P38DRAFT_2561458 [Favolaschia claudopus]|uniref:Uncharacterized protein n=1 Tax=Favolaschia claudopus TaxID=2862362 RepID=A0AAW0A2Q9_9AGAR
MAEILAWATKILETDPVYPPIQLAWDDGWLTNSRISFPDERSYWRMKILAARNRHIEEFKDLLALAIRHAIPFEICLKRADVRKINDLPISALLRTTLSALYRPGYVDEPLVHNRNGEVATYTDYLVRIHTLLRRPESVAFIRMGGVYRFVASLYYPELVQGFAEGPSLQVTHFDKGETRLFDAGTSEFYTLDSVSQSEIGMLLGHIPGTDQDSDRTLWPPAEVFEDATWVMNGYLSAQAYGVLESVKKGLFRTSNPKIVWRTRGNWHTFFRNGEVNAARLREDAIRAQVPQPSDWEAGNRLFNEYFPVDWRDQDISEIVLPEILN